MRKATLFVAFLLALASCGQKDCEKDKTATLVVNNAANERIYVNISDNKDAAIEPGHSQRFEIDLLLPGATEPLYQTVLPFSRESSRTTIEKEVVIYNQCQTTEVTID